MYFNNFPTINYNDKELCNILIKFNSINLYKDSTFLENYYLQDEDTPENISYRMYKDSGYSWVVLFVNEMFNREFDWPLNATKMDEFVSSKYNYSSVFFSDEKINFSFSKVKKINNYKILSYDRDLNKFNLNTKINSLPSTVNLYDKDDILIKQIQPDRVVYEGSQGLNKFEINNKIINARQLVSQGGISYLHGYINSISNPIVESAVVTNSQYEYKLNDSKKQIVLLKQQYIFSFMDSLKTELSKLNNLGIGEDE